MKDRLHRSALFDLTGRTALVTGASSGIGARFARVLAANGARVVLAARREAMLGELRDEIVAAGGSAVPIAMDVTDEASTNIAFDRAEEAFGTVDIIVANAGIGQDVSALKLSMEEFDGIFAVNVRGTFLTAREGMRRLRGSEAAKRGDARIILTSSITGSAIVPGIAAYGASKAAVTQLGRTLAREWANRGVNINILCPGYILTDLNATVFAEERGIKMRSGWPRERLMEIDALDGALLFLASGASRFTTGAVIDIDDGQML